MEYKYKTVKATVTDEEGKLHAVYGIECTDIADVAVRRIDNIFTSRDDAERLTALMNALSLSPIHIDDVIADAIAG